MTFIEKHKLGGRTFKSAAGYPVIIDYNCPDTDKIVGFVRFDSGYLMPIEWDINGDPLKLPLHQGLGLVPLREVISYEVIPVDERV